MFRSRNNPNSPQHKHEEKAPVVHTLPRNQREGYDERFKERTKQGGPDKWSSRNPGGPGPSRGPSKRQKSMPNEDWRAMMSGR